MTEIRSANDIVDIVGGYVELKPTGGQRFKGLCPFHSEKTPSFIVSRDRQTYHCFGCDKGGDTIEFLREIDGLSFMESLKTLADRAGMRMPESSRRENSREDQQRDELRKLSTFAAKLYCNTLENPMTGRAGRDYLAQRELKPETLERFGVGFVPDEWRTLTDAARREGTHDSIIEQSGLAKRGDRGGLYDLFRNRVIFPIKETRGAVVAFGGRDLGDSPAKYINSPENPIYKKGNTLYALHEGREALRKSGEAILVEGYFDVLRCFDAGIENAVATCGTALTPEQATALGRVVSSVLVVFDGDEAGIRAALKSIGILTHAGLTVRAMALPDGQDPDDYIRAEGPEAFRALAAEASDFVTFYVRMNVGRTNTIEGRTAVARELFAIFRDIEDGLRQDEYLRLSARELGLNEQKCREEYTRFSQNQDAPAGIYTEDEERRAPVNDFDRDFVAILMNDKRLLGEASEALVSLELGDSVLLEVVRALQSDSGDDCLAVLESESARRLYLAASAADPSWGENGEKYIMDRLDRFRKDALLARRTRLQEEIQQAERLNDDAKSTELARAFDDVNRELRRSSAA